MYHTNFVEQNLVLEVVRVMSFGIKLDLFAVRLSLSVGCTILGLHVSNLFGLYCIDFP